MRSIKSYVMEQPPKSFDPNQFDYMRFFPSETQQYLREQTKTDDLLRRTAEEHPEIPEVSYEAFFLMDSVIAQVHGSQKLHNPRVYVPIIDEAYQQLRANGQDTDLRTIQLSAALKLHDIITEKTIGGRYPYAAISETFALNFFIDFAEGILELEQRGQLNIDTTRQL